MEDQTELLNILREPCNFTNSIFAYDHMKENPDKFSLIISEFSLTPPTCLKFKYYHSIIIFNILLYNNQLFFPNQHRIIKITPLSEIGYKTFIVVIYPKWHVPEGFFSKNK